MAGPDRTALIRANEGVMACELGDGLALLDQTAGTFFTLDEVGAFIWQRLQDPATVVDVATAVAAEFDAPEKVIERDVDSFVKDLLSARLLVAA